MSDLKEKYENRSYSIKLTQVTKSFGKNVLFRNFSYTFPKSGIYAIVGNSGKGKTTLLRIIAGLDKRYSGELSVYGSISFMFQEHRLFPTLSALDNVLDISFDARTEENEAAARELLLKLNFKEDELSKFPSELSGGMRQRISFARAILKRSDILILDEPTKELDGELREKVIEIIKSEADRRLVIIVSHSKEDQSELSATQIII